MTTRLTALAALVLSAQANAAELKTTTKAGAVTQPRTVQQIASKKFCFTIDKQTGEQVPCDRSVKTGGSNTGSSSPATPNEPEPVEPFDAVDWSQTESDFFDDEISVLPAAYLMSQLSAMAYKSPSQAQSIATELGLDYVGVVHEEFIAPLDFGGAQGESTAYVMTNDQAVFVAFEGSTGTNDWVESNIDFWPVAMPSWGSSVLAPWNVVTIHNGFFQATDIIFDDLLDTIQPHLAGRELWLTGHSLGGAVAQLTAFRLTHDKGVDVQGVHVFGAPAVGDDDWAVVFENTMSNVHRWNLEGDPAPLATQAPMFYHVGIVNNLRGNGAMQLGGGNGDMMGYNPQCWLPGWGAIVTHMNYWPRLGEELAQHEPALAATFPESLPGVDATCPLP